MLRDLQILDRERTAPRSLEPRHVPVVLDLHVARRNQKIGEIEELAALVEYLRAEQQPLGELAAGTERPETVQEPSAVRSPHRLAARRENGGDHGVRVAPIDLVLGPVREVRHQPAMGVHDPQHPRRRPAALGDRGDDVEMRAHREFMATAPARLDDGEESLLADAPEVLLGDAAVLLRRRRARPQLVRNRLGARDEICRQGVDIPNCWPRTYETSRGDTGGCIGSWSGTWGNRIRRALTPGAWGFPAHHGVCRSPSGG